MPFVTKFSKSLILKSISGELIETSYKVYEKEIYFLNRLDVSNLYHFDMFCQNIINKENIIIYKEFVPSVSNEFVFEGGKPSYHKYEDCPKLHSNFVNIRIPHEIKLLGDEKVDEFILWVKSNYELFQRDFSTFIMRYKLKFSNIQLDVVNYHNSGLEYMDNFTKEILCRRIDSLLNNSAKYFNYENERKGLIRRYQKALFLAFKDEELVETFGYTDREAKNILKEYFHLFVEPTKFYLEELIKIKYKNLINNFEFGETLLDSLNFKKCSTCFNDNFVHSTDNFYSIFKQKFGNFTVTKEAGVFDFKAIENTPFSITFILTRVYKLLDSDPKIDKNGNIYFLVSIDYINQYNHYQYATAFFYCNEVNEILLFQKYLTRVTLNRNTNKLSFQLYKFETI